MKRQEFPPQEQGLPQMPHQMLSKHPQKPQPMPQAARPPSNAQMAGHPQQAQFAGANFPLSNSAVHQHLQLQVPQMSTPQELKKKGETLVVPRMPVACDAYNMYTYWRGYFFLIFSSGVLKMIMQGELRDKECLDKMLSSAQMLSRTWAIRWKLDLEIV